MLIVDFDSGSVNVLLLETLDYIKYVFRNQESYHDGGGSSSEVWYVYPAPIDDYPQELLHDREYDHIRIPRCQGFWIENGHLYLVEPWDIPGVFEYYYKEKNRYYSESPTEIREVGFNLYKK